MGGRRVAVTGATGFLGRHVVRVFREAGWRVRIIARRDPIALSLGEVEVVPGDLDDGEALRTLCAGAELVVHAGGLIKAARAADFTRVNVRGAANVAAAVESVAPAARVLLVSSLAAREPSLSGYAASKRRAEDAMSVLGERLIVVRPTAIYGPGDQETFQFIAAAAKGWPLPLFDSAARLTTVHVDDVARELVAFADGPARSQPQAICDDHPEGYSWRELMMAISAAVGTNPKLLRLPAMALRVAGWAGQATHLIGKPAIVSPGKVRELLHPDWSIADSERSRSGHVPGFTLERGLADTVAWARNHGWLGLPAR
jgi:nucleoside-diphosphate-sugar epimerase